MTDSKLFEEFKVRYNNVYKTDPVRISSIAYDAMDVLITLIGKNKKGIQRADFEEDLIHYRGIIRTGFSGIDGMFRFLPNGIVQRNLSVLEVKEDRFEIIEDANNFFLEY